MILDITQFGYGAGLVLVGHIAGMIVGSVFNAVVAVRRGL